MTAFVESSALGLLKFVYPFEFFKHRGNLNTFQLSDDERKDETKML